MLRCMYSGISGMKVNQQKLDVIGNNIANVSTTAFKASSARFKDMLYQNSSSASAPTSNKGGTNAAQVGLGAQLASINRLMSQGNALSTSRSLDVCVDGEGYIIVGSGNVDYSSAGTSISADMGIAGGDMSINYTRDGNLTLDKEGNLLTSDGYRVMGYLVTSYPKKDSTTEPQSATSSLDKSGVARYVNPDGILKVATNIQDVVPTDTAKGTMTGTKAGTSGGGELGSLQPLRIPNEVYVPAYKDASGNDVAGGYQKVSSFTIGKDGLITAILGNGTKTALGQIATATFSNPEGLTALGGNLYEVSANSGSEIVRSGVNMDKKQDGTDAKTGLDNSKGFGDLIQGCLESSNVDLTEQFTDMITATRSFEASSKMITTGDEILQTITGLIR